MTALKFAEISYICTVYLLYGREGINHFRFIVAQLKQLVIVAISWPVMHQGMATAFCCKDRSRTRRNENIKPGGNKALTIFFAMKEKEQV